MFWVDVGVGYCANPADMSQYIINRQYATKTVSECRAVCAATSGCISIAISSSSSNNCWIYGVVPAISGFGQNSNGAPIPTALSVVGKGDVGVTCFALRPGASSCVFVSGLCDSMENVRSGRQFCWCCGFNPPVCAYVCRWVHVHLLQG